MSNSEKVGVVDDWCGGDNHRRICRPSRIPRARPCHRFGFRIVSADRTAGFQPAPFSASNLRRTGTRDCQQGGPGGFQRVLGGVHCAYSRDRVYKGVGCHANRARMDARRSCLLGGDSRPGSASRNDHRALPWWIPCLATNPRSKTTSVDFVSSTEK